jgi:hypothetical protein
MKEAAMQTELAWNGWLRPAADAATSSSITLAELNHMIAVVSACAVYTSSSRHRDGKCGISCLMLAVGTGYDSYLLFSHAHTLHGTSYTCHKSHVMHAGEQPPASTRRCRTGHGSPPGSRIS